MLPDNEQLLGRVGAPRRRSRIAPPQLAVLVNDLRLSIPSRGGIVISTLVADVNDVIVIPVIPVIADHAPGHRVRHVRGEPDRRKRAGRQRRRVRAGRAFVLGALVAEVQQEARHQDGGQAGGGREKGISSSTAVDSRLYGRTYVTMMSFSRLEPMFVT